MHTPHDTPRSCGCAGGVRLFCTDKRHAPCVFHSRLSARNKQGGLMGARAGGSVSGMAGLVGTGRPGGLSLGKTRAPTRAALPFRWSRSRNIVDC